MPFSYWVRETSNPAQASTLVIGPEAAVQLTFTDDSPFIAGVDSAGDLVLEQGGTATTYGTTDPDTWAIVGGTTYRVVYDAVSTLPNDRRVPDSLVGDPVYVVRLYSLTDPPVIFKSYFFSPESATNIVGSQAVMNSFGQGRLDLNANMNPEVPVYLCFCCGTEIETPSGPRKVETLVAGEFVLNEHGEEHQIHWVGRSRVSLDTMRSNQNLAPIRIAAGAFGPAMPNADLYVSPQHRIVLDGPAAELLFAQTQVLAAAKHLVGTFAERVEPEADVEYFHILTEAHEILVSNGLRTESFQPARRTIDVMSPETQAVLEEALSIFGRDDMLTRKDALPSLNRGEACTIAAMMKGWQAQPQRSAKTADAS